MQKLGAETRRARQDGSDVGKAEVDGRSEAGKKKCFIIVLGTYSRIIAISPLFPSFTSQKRNTGCKESFIGSACRICVLFFPSKINVRNFILVWQ